ncbi:hypothetical protein HXX76_009978 [Chlamydomonas incerta]|uniref:Uncharacterized protein n=1 Tax=Chlamydomonas incerta TaxID=51695 RepID=A0A835T0Z6_CHLIN|nr:hypothetical protein HXX76_009978 [Chlamydomonas incerta]|eukprot:KAG2430455.1 hypothetical protein HXX76_009978 [Chlamydomonas incerta]
MAARQALGRALIAAGGTMVVLTVGTGAISGVAMGVAKVFIDREKSKKQAPCVVCRSNRRVACEVCEGERIIKYWPTPEPPPAQLHTWSVCSMCEGAGDHPCINCQGTGSVYPQAWDLAEQEAALREQLALAPVPAAAGQHARASARA